MMRQNLQKCSSVISDEIDQFDIVIIGAGLSGLTAAFRLFQLKPNLRIKLLEAKDRIGGRILSTELPAANNSIDVWDIGGSWIGNKVIQPFINQLIAELNLTPYPQNFKGKKIIEVGKNFKASHYSSSIPEMGLLSIYDTYTLIRYINSVQKRLFKNKTLSSKDEEYFDSITTDTFFNQRIWTQNTSDIAKAAIRACFGCEQNKISALYSMIYFNSCGNFMNLFESGDESYQGYKIAGGAQMICSRILEVIEDDILEMDTVVTFIEERTNEKMEKYSVVGTRDGKSYKAKHVIVAIPPHLITNIRFQPSLSPKKYEYFSSIIPGHLIKVILTYETPFWRNLGYSGEIVTNGGRSYTDGCTTGPLCIVFDATTSNNSPALVGLIGGTNALEYEGKSKNERKEAVLKSLERFFKKELVRNFIVYCEKIWRQEQYVGGCPTCAVPTGVAKLLCQNIRDPENRIHFASSELAKYSIGLMEGAVESGEKAALEILSEY